MSTPTPEEVVTPSVPPEPIDTSPPQNIIPPVSTPPVEPTSTSTVDVVPTSTATPTVLPPSESTKAEDTVVTSVKPPNVITTLPSPSPPPLQSSTSPTTIPKDAAKVEAPKKEETKKEEAPKKEAGKTEAPQIEESKEAPAPVVAKIKKSIAEQSTLPTTIPKEEAKVEAPKKEEAKNGEAPKKEAAKTEAPKVEESKEAPAPVVATKKISIAERSDSSSIDVAAPVATPTVTPTATPATTTPTTTPTATPTTTPTAAPTAASTKKTKKPLKTNKISTKGKPAKLTTKGKPKPVKLPKGKSPTANKVAPLKNAKCPIRINCNQPGGQKPSLNFEQTDGNFCAEMTLTNPTKERYIYQLNLHPRDNIHIQNINSKGEEATIGFLGEGASVVLKLKISNVRTITSILTKMKSRMKKINPNSFPKNPIVLPLNEKFEINFTKTLQKTINSKTTQKTLGIELKTCKDNAATMATPVCVLIHSSTKDATGRWIPDLDQKAAAGGTGTITATLSKSLLNDLKQMEEKEKIPGANQKVMVALQFGFGNLTSKRNKNSKKIFEMLLNDADKLTMDLKKVNGNHVAMTMCQPNVVELRGKLMYVRISIKRLTKLIRNIITDNNFKNVFKQNLPVLEEDLPKTVSSSELKGDSKETRQKMHEISVGKNKYHRKYHVIYQFPKDKPDLTKKCLAKLKYYGQGYKKKSGAEINIDKEKLMVMVTATSQHSANIARTLIEKTIEANKIVCDSIIPKEPFKLNILEQKVHDDAVRGTKDVGTKHELTRRTAHAAVEEKNEQDKPKKTLTVKEKAKLEKVERLKANKEKADKLNNLRQLAANALKAGKYLSEGASIA